MSSSFSIRTIADKARNKVDDGATLSLLLN